MKYNNPKLTGKAQDLRKNMTKEERHLWYDFLKGLPLNANRQKVLGPYIVDFYIARARLVSELDGAQHFEPEHQQKDALRDEYLNGLGLTVLRYTNADVRQRFEAVCQDILWHIAEREPTSSDG